MTDIGDIQVVPGHSVAGRAGQQVQPFQYVSRDYQRRQAFEEPGDTYVVFGHDKIAAFIFGADLLYAAEVSAVRPAHPAAQKMIQMNAPCFHRQAPGI
jgi:hypothetical protein